MAVEKKNTSSGMAAAQRLINEMVANRTVGTDYYRSSKSGLDSTSPGATSGSTASKSQSADEYVTKRLGELGLTHRRVDNAYIQSFITDAGKYMNSVTSDKVKSGYGTISSIYASRKKQADDLRSRSFEIQRYLDNNKDSLDAETYNSLKKYLDDFDRASSQSIYAFYKNNEFFSQFATEDDYLKWDTAQKDYEAKANLDLDAAEKEIADLEAEYDAWMYGDDAYWYDATDTNERKKYDQMVEDWERRIAENRLFYNQAKQIQEGIRLSSVADPTSDLYDPEFKSYSRYVSTELDGWLNRQSSKYSMGYDDLTYEYINNQNGIREEVEQRYRTHSLDGFDRAGESTYKENGYDLLTEDEIAIYNYYYSRDGKEAAQKYLDNIQETLNYRKATGMYNNMEDKTALELAFGIVAGYDQFESGVTNLFNTEDDYIAPSAYQIASGMVREDLADKSIPVWYNIKEKKWEDKVFGNSAAQVGYDAITTTANMAPSIVSSIAANMMVPGSGAFVGNTLMFASSAGNAYQEALNLGYDKGQARAYSTMVGASEAGLQYLLGGIGSLGGTSKAVSKMLNGVDNAFIRTAAKIGGNMASEGLEEGLQEILTPWFKNLALHAGEDIDWSEVAYSSLLGALTAGFMEGPGTISGEVNNYRTGKALQGADISAQRLADLGKTFSADTVAHQLAGRVNENTGAYTMGRLFNEIGATLTEQNVNDITQALVAKGMTLDHARANARAMAVVVEGGNLTDTQVKIIEENDVLADAVRATIIDSNATWFQRTKGYNEALMALAQEKTSGKKQNSPGQENTSASDTVDAKNESSAEGEAEAAVDIGPVKVKSIADIKNGRAMIKLEDDTEVNVKDADVDPDDGVRIETIASIDGISTSDANFILSTLRDSTNASAQMDSLGAKEAYKYGFYGFSKDHLTKHGVFANSLTDTQRNAIYEAGKSARQRQVEKAAPKGASKQTGIYFDHGSGNVTEVSLSDLRGLKDYRRAGVQAGMLLKKLGLGGNIVFFESYRNSNNQLVYKDRNGNEVKAPNGWYSKSDGSVHIDLNAGDTGQGYVLFTLAHELTHFIEQWSEAKYKVLADFLVENYEQGQSMNKLVLAKQKYLSELRNKEVSYAEAYSEVVADSMEAMLADENVLQKLVELKARDNSLVAKFKQFFDNMAARISNIYKGLTPDVDEYTVVLETKESIERLQQLFAEALAEASENYQSFAEMEVNTDAIPVESGTQYSYRSLAEAAGFVAVENADGTRAFTRDGNRVSQVTVEDIENSPIGAFINFSVDKKDISAEEAKRQKEMFAQICTMACKTNDFAMAMQFVGSAVFTGMKANADKQYGTTYDFPSICTKTQAVIDAMSAKMVKLGRGLNSAEIVKLYQDVFASGNPVPCPECYVFSRWIGIGGLLDNIKKYQDYYGNMDVTEVAEAYLKMRSEVAQFAEEQGISFGKAKGALTSKLTKEFNKLTEKVEKAQNQGEKVKPTDLKRLEELEPMMNTVKGMTWLENVYFADSSLKKVNPRFRVPDSVLFDLNNGEAFATQYKEAWAFRTTQGAGYGKAITPYAEARLGEGILVTNNTTNTIKGKAKGTLDNFFLNQRGKLDKKSRDALERARVKQKIQAFIGGQRFQSTSDARYENASDYLLAALEMQAMHGMVQVYTKVDGAVPAFSAWGFSINQSLMPLGGGLDANGNVKDTSVGGMNPKIADDNRKKHETAGTITIGVNDNHIRAMFGQLMRDFIIPYHASGGKADVVAAFRGIQEGQEKRGQMVRSTDYSRTQSDKVLSDEVLRWQGKTPAQIQRIHEIRAARIAILTGGKVDMDVVRSNRFLSELYDKIHDGEWKGVKLAKSKVESQIFPNEFWDQSVSYENSGKITRDYLEYCNDLGFLHRFSGTVPSNGKLVPVNGYDQNGNRVQLTDLAYKYDENGKMTDQVEDFFWKVLTDRRMYDNNGKYLPQKVVTLKDTTKDTITGFAQGNYGRQYNKDTSMALVNAILGIKTDVHTDDANAIAEQATDAVNTLQFSDRDQVRRDETYSAIGKELLTYEEGDMAPDLTLVETVNERTGKTETTIKHFGQKPKGYVPKKIAYCYKLFEQHPDGTLHALFAGAKGETPIGVWQYAQGFPYTDAGVKGMNLRERYGWHLSAGLPAAPHLMSPKDFGRGYPSKNSYGHPKGSKRVWVRMAYDASTDFNSVADSTNAGDIFGLIPFGGYYAFKENNQSEWVISSAVKIDKILTEDERQQILKDAGFDEYEAWRKKFRPTEAEKAESKRKSAENKKAKDSAKKAGLNYLSESSRAMRESIQSRIIDNPEIQYSDRGYGGIREVLAKKGLDELSKRYGSHFPLSGSFDATMNDDNTPLVMETVAAKSVRGKGSPFVVGRKAFIAAYGTKTSVHIKQMGIDADLYANVANESISKAVGHANVQSTLDVIPHISKVLENSILMGVERIAHTGNKGTALYGYRLYNLYWYDDGKAKTPHALVCTVVQDLNKAEGYVFQNIENVTIDRGLPGTTAGMSSSVNDDTYTVAQLYRTVKKIDRFDGGLKYTDDERERYLFSYTERNDGVKYSDRNSDSVSNRSLLANALESAAQNDIERKRIQEYKEKIDTINAEERKLQELRERIKDLSFAKGPKDTKAIRSLQFEANQTANRISTYDKQLLRLEASKPLQNILTREKEMARKRAEQKGKEALADYRERATRTQRELLEKWQDSRKRGIDSRNRTAMRHKIKDIVNELNQYLLKGTKDRHVPIGLQKAVAEALNAVNMDTVGAEERIAKLNADLMKAKTPEEIQEISKKIEHIREMGDRLDEKLNRLKAAYDELINSDDPLIANSHDDAVSAHMMRLIVRVGDTPLREMTIDQLQDVYDVYKVVLATIRNANKSFKDNKNREISTRANQVMDEIDNLGVKRGKRPVFMSWIEKFGWDNLKPVYAMEHIGSRGLIEAYNNVRDGEDTWARDIMEAREFYLDKFKKYGYDSWDFEKKRTFTSTTGKNFELTLDQIMSLYAYSKRDQAEDHLKYGGIVFDPKTEVVEQTRHGIKVKYNVANATAYNISEETLADIISNLTPEQKSFADEMQDYLSTVMGAKGNEVSLAMYDVKLFREKHYFPLKSAHQYMARAKEQAQGDVKIKNSGFSKETKPHAKNPIVLSSFMDVWTNHVNEMSMYHAFVLPMEDFYRIYNYTTPSKNENMPTEGVTAYIENAYGSGATGYIDQMLKDLNGGARTDSRTGFMNKMIGTFKKGAVFASLSVVVQQPSAIARAAALVDTKYFIGPKVDHKRRKALWEEVKQYAPVAIIKEMGYFDTNMGKSTQDFILGKEYSGFKEKMQALVTDSGYRDEVLSKAPALADEIAWCGIWEAVKRETKANNTGMDTKSEAFLKKAGARFTEVITKTQVYDSVLARSANMRSKDTGMKMATAFMAEPTTSINMIADALLQGKRGNRKYCRAAIGAVIASQILNSILVSFVYAARDDDEDESYWEKYVESLAGGLFDSLNPAGYIPFVKDIISIVQGYDVERSDMAVISDLWKAWQNLGNDKMSAYRKFEGFVGSIGQIFGLPAKNIMRDGRAIYQTVMSFVEGRQTTKAGIEYAVKSGIPAWMGGGDVSNQNQLYEAYLSGDKTQIARVESRFKDKSAVSSAIRKALRDNDPRIREAAIAWNDDDLDEYMRIAKEIIGEKHFSQDDVVMAIRAEASALAPADDEAGTSKAKGLFTTEKFAEAISQGDNAMADAIRTDIIQTAQKNGKTEAEAEKNFNSSAKGALEDMYLSGDISDSKAIDALVDYCGFDQDDASATVKKWSFEADFGFAYSDMKDEFVAGKISASQAQNALMEYGGKEQDDAEETVREWEFLREYEFEWSDRGDLYKDGDITRSDLRTILINEGGMTGEEADLQIQAYDWQAQGYEGATMAAVREYNKHCASVNVPKDIYLHIRRFSNNTENDVVDGKPVSYSAMKRVMVEINAQRLTSSQKTAIARSLGWSEKNIRKYKLW